MKDKLKLSTKELTEMVKRSIGKVLKENEFSSPDPTDPTKREMLNFLRNKYDKLGYDQNSAEIAIYWFAYEYNGGQWSNLYSSLSTSPYKPGRNQSDVFDTEDDLAIDMYNDLCDEYTEDGDEYYDDEDDYSSDRDSYNQGEYMNENEENVVGEPQDNNNNNIVEYKIPTWAAAAMINADYSGLEDEDIEAIKKFTNQLVQRHGNAHISAGEEVGFKRYNDMTSLGDNVMTVYVMPSNVNESKKVIRIKESELRELVKQKINEIKNNL